MDSRVRIVQNHLEALYLRAFLVPFWARENILKTRILILAQFGSIFVPIFGLFLAFFRENRSNFSGIALLATTRPSRCLDVAC